MFKVAVYNWRRHENRNTYKKVRIKRLWKYKCNIVPQALLSQLVDTDTLTMMEWSKRPKFFRLRWTFQNLFSKIEMVGDTVRWCRPNLLLLLFSYPGTMAIVANLSANAIKLSINISGNSGLTWEISSIDRKRNNAIQLPPIQPISKDTSSSMEFDLWRHILYVGSGYVCYFYKTNLKIEIVEQKIKK